MNIRFGIRAKILTAFLALTLVALGVLSSLAIHNIAAVGNAAKQNSISMGESITTESIAALENLGRRIIQRRAEYAASEAALYLQYHPNLSIAEIKQNQELKEIVVQNLGQTGYTMMYDQSYIVYFHPDSKLVGANLHKLAGEPPHYWSILERSLSGPASGYYGWEDEEGNLRSKYMYCAPVEDTVFVVAAVTFIDEFTEPGQEMKDRIAIEVTNTGSLIDNQLKMAQLTFIIIIVSVILVAAGVIFLLSRAITRPILALTKGAEVIAKGELDYSINVETGDEIQHLAEQFNKMAQALKESYSNLEHKVAKRTIEERQRAEQLRTLNEVSRKISSIVNLDELLPYVGNLLRETFNYYNVNIFLFEPDSGQLTLKALCISGQKGIIPVEVPLELGEEGIVGRVARTGEPIIINDVRAEPNYYVIEALKDTKSELAVAVKMGGKVLGVLDIESIEVDAFDEADLFTAQTLADQLAVAIDNAHLYEETRQIAVMEERNRMAREIHDTLAQGFSGIILQLEAAEQAMEEDPSEVHQHLDKARGLARKSLNEARRSVWDLRPQVLEQIHLVEALKQEVDRFAQDSNINARFTVTGNRRNLSSEVESGLLRICQESLNNIRKHSKATDAEVNLVFDDSSIKLIISDNGIGFNPEIPSKTDKKRKSFGLISMKERARGINGTLEVKSEQKKGTTITASIPGKK